MNGGVCDGSIPQWYFDTTERACVGFTYGGCGGNANRFISSEHCERNCGKYRNKGNVTNSI